MIENLAALRVFVRVGRKGSFSAAGRELNIPQSTVSRMVSGLEKEIGVQLLTRTTRAVTLTEAGADFLGRAESLLVDLEEAEQAARGSYELRGVLRVGLSSSFALRELLPNLGAFTDQHPDLKIELITDDYRQNLIIEGVDIAFRFGTLIDSSAVARKLASWPRALVASPAYLARAGTPNTPASLAKHNVILGPSGLGRAWSFTRNGKVTAVRVDGRLTATMTEVAIKAAIEGMGIASAALRALEPELERGTLVRLLPEWEIGTVDLHAVFAAGKAAKPAARALANYVAEHYQGSGA